MPALRPALLSGSQYGLLTQTLTQTRKNWGGGEGAYGAERICNLTKDGQTDTKPSVVISRVSWGSRGRGFKSRHSDQKSLEILRFQGFFFALSGAAIKSDPNLTQKGKWGQIAVREIIAAKLTAKDDQYVCALADNHDRGKPHGRKAVGLSQEGCLRL